jgi:hypothetical protein
MLPSPLLHMLISQCRDPLERGNAIVVKAAQRVRLARAHRHRGLPFPPQLAVSLDGRRPRALWR